MRFFVHIRQITVPILPFLRPCCASDPVIFKTVRKRIRHAFPKLTGKNAKSGAVTKQPGNPFQSNLIQQESGCFTHADPCAPQPDSTRARYQL